MSILRELVTVLSFKTDEAGLEKAEKGFKSLLKMSGAFVAGAGGIVAGLFAITKSAADAGDAARDAGKRLGVTAVEIQKMEFAAGQSGVSMGALESGMKFLQRAAVQSTTSNKRAAAAFAQLGIKVRDAKGQIKGGPELLQEAVTGLDKMKNASRKAELSMTLFGRGAGTSFLQLEDFAKNMQRAEELGGIISKDDADAADDFNDSLGEMTVALAGITRRLGTKLLPIFKRFIDLITEWTIENRELIDNGLNLLVAVVKFVADGMEALAKFVDKNRTFMALLVGIGVLPLVKALGALFIAQLKVVALPALATIGWLAFAAILALVTEEIDAFISGNKKSVLQDLVDFLDRPPKVDDHPMVNVLRTIRDMAREAADGITVLFALMSGEEFATMSDGRKIKLGKSMLPDFLTPDKRQERLVERIDASGTFIDPVYKAEQEAAGIFRYTKPSFSEPAMNSFFQPTVTVTVESPPNASPQQVGNAAAEGAQRGVQQAYDQTRSRWVR